MRIASTLVTCLLTCHSSESKPVGVVYQEGLESYDLDDVARVKAALKGKTKQEIRQTIEAMKKKVKSQQKAKPPAPAPKASKTQKTAESTLDKKLKSDIAKLTSKSTSELDGDTLDDDDFEQDLDDELAAIADGESDAPPKRTIPMGTPQLDFSESFAEDFTDMMAQDSLKQEMSQESLESDLLEDLDADLEKKYLAEELAGIQEAKKSQGASLQYLVFVIGIALAAGGVWYSHGSPMPVWAHYMLLGELDAVSIPGFNTQSMDCKAKQKLFTATAGSSLKSTTGPGSSFKQSSDLNDFGLSFSYDSLGYGGLDKGATAHRTATPVHVAASTKEMPGVDDFGL